MREEISPDGDSEERAVGPALSPVPPAFSAPAPRWWGHPFQEVRWQAELARLLIDQSWGAFAKAMAHCSPEKVAAVVSPGAGPDAPFDISIPTQWTLSAFRTLYAHPSDRVARNGCLTDTCRRRFTADYTGEFPAQVPLTSLYRRSWRVPVLAMTTIQYLTHTIHNGIDVNDANNSWAGPFDLASLGLATIQFAALLGLLLRRETVPA